MNYLSLILFQYFICYAHGNCSFKMSTQQACDSIATLAKVNDFAKYEQIYDMIKAVLDKLETESISTEAASKSPNTCSELTDEELWNSLKERQEVRRDSLENLQSKCNNLRVRYEEIRKRSSKQLDKLEQSRRQYQTSVLLKNQLQNTVTELSAAVKELQSRSDGAEKALAEKKLTFDKLESDFKACNEKVLKTGIVLSQLFSPSPKEDYRLTENIDDGQQSFDLTSMVTNLVNRLDEKQGEVDEKQDEVNELVSQVERLRTDNANLRATMAQQQQEMIKKEECIEEVTVWQAIQDESQISSPVDVCLNEVTSDFCSFEATDLTHNETCWFERKLPSDYYWRIISNERTFRGRETSVMDHTCSSISGRFMYVDMAQLMPGQEARLTSYVLRSNSRQCFSFWYNIGYNFNYGKFYATVLMRRSSLQVWRQNLVIQDEWQYTSFEVPPHVARDGYRIQLVAEGNGPGYVALDDLALTTGACRRQQ
ncbi:putative leucine-rich repeat-containing protein DDB_G0290503 [Watersipora subatra]|uniref:putative leucine-rich repeat-containing protein DDB_G0290503 n=1 Tax=Watersipora subatra TaxID=2589382 RepID=UPI00355B367D